MLTPQVIKKETVSIKECSCCGNKLAGEKFIRVKSPFFLDNLAPMCNSCIQRALVKNDWNWEDIDRICQMLDIPFIPEEFEKLYKLNGDIVFPIYAKVLQEGEYERFGWGDYHREFKALRRLNLLENELPEIRENKFRELRKKWGSAHDEEELMYLDSLYNGMLATQNVNGALQIDQAKKVCKISLDIDKKIEAGMPVDKIISGLEKVLKAANFTPKNVKDANDFSSFSEVAFWLEKQGWLNSYYDGTTKDVVDETLNNLQAFTQRLYLNEGNLGEDITNRAEAIRVANVLETDGNYDLDSGENLDNFENAGYENLIREETDMIIDDDDSFDKLGRTI